jgi:Na+(H+)/acetate symporter ActP
MLLNFAVSYGVSMFTPEPPEEVQDMVDSIRHPN